MDTELSYFRDSCKSVCKSEPRGINFFLDTDSLVNFSKSNTTEDINMTISKGHSSKEYTKLNSSIIDEKKKIDE
jgi:hypothetical protein